MTLSIQEIKNLLSEQKYNWEHVTILDFFSKKHCKEVIKNDFLLANNITDRFNKFSDDIDYDEVCNLREKAMIEVLASFGFKNSNDYDDAIEGLEFSHICAGCSVNKVTIEAYFLDNTTYKLVRFTTKADGTIDSDIKVLEISISIDYYNKLESNPDTSLVRFDEVNGLFYDE